MSLLAFCAWAVAANLAGMLPSRRSHWPAAYVLIVTGLPLLAWVFLAKGPLWGVVCLAAMMSVLRWPALHALRWISHRTGLRK